MFLSETFKNYIRRRCNMPKKELRYPLTVTTRFPEAVAEAVAEIVKDKQKEFPRYSEADLIRSAVVNHLKSKGKLDRNKDYL